MEDTTRSQTVSTKLQRITEQAAQYPDIVFTTLAHLMDVDFLWEAYRQTRKNASPGVDKVTAKDYAENLEANLFDLHMRLKSGRYFAPPVERVWLDKENGKKRPIGKTTFEDKIVQRAVVMLLEPIYEQMFYDFSHGFRRGHSQHQAVHEVREMCLKLNIGWILSADISGLFDNIEHHHLREVIKQKVNDGGIIRLIGKWLNAGVFEGGRITYPDKGTPQGGVISPMLSNIFLHHVLDDWFVKQVKPRIQGRCFIIRYADDFIIGFEKEEDAHKVMKVLSKRFGKYGLEINEDKTTLIPFKNPGRKSADEPENKSFDFLGFTFYWSKSRRGYWVIKKKTAKKRLARFMRSLWHWCRNNRHLPLKEQYGAICAKLRGYYQYFGVICNYKALAAVYEYAQKAWRYWLSRRSHKGWICWDKFQIIKSKFKFPCPKIVHNI